MPPRSGEKKSEFLNKKTRSKLELKKELSRRQNKFENGRINEGEREQRIRRSVLVVDQVDARSVRIPPDPAHVRCRISILRLDLDALEAAVRDLQDGADDDRLV